MFYLHVTDPRYAIALLALAATGLAVAVLRKEPKNSEQIIKDTHDPK